MNTQSVERVIAVGTIMPIFTVSIGRSAVDNERYVLAICLTQRDGVGGKGRWEDGHKRRRVGEAKRLADRPCPIALSTF